MAETTSERLFHVTVALMLTVTVGILLFVAYDLTNDPVYNFTYVHATVVEFSSDPAFVSVALKDGGVYAASLPPSALETFKPGQEVIACLRVGKLTHKVIKVVFVYEKPHQPNV